MSTLRICAVAMYMSTAALVGPPATQAQEVIYQYSSPVWHPETVHYHRTYQERSWNWSHHSGWYLRDNYVDVPHIIPGHYSYASVMPFYMR